MPSLRRSALLRVPFSATINSAVLPGPNRPTNWPNSRADARPPGLSETHRQRQPTNRRLQCEHGLLRRAGENGCKADIELYCGVSRRRRFGLGKLRNLRSSPEITDSRCFAGAWQLATIWLYGPGIQFLLDPLTLMASNQVKIQATMLTDVAFRFAA